MAGQKVAEYLDCDAYALFAAASLTGKSFEGTIDAFVAEGAERGMEYGYRLLGVPEDGRIVPIYDGHTEQFLQLPSTAEEKRSWFQRFFRRGPTR